MDYETYRRLYVVDPPPKPRFAFGSTEVTLFFDKYPQVVEYYSQVLGPPGYIEGDSTTSWQIGSNWITLLRGRSGAPTNMEVAFKMQTPAAAEQLQKAFIDAGGEGEPPSDQIMFKPVRYCPVVDPFGTNILAFAQLDGH